MQRGLVFTTSLLLKRLKTVISSALRDAFFYAILGMAARRKKKRSGERCRSWVWL